MMRFVARCLRWVWDHPPGYLWTDYVMRRRKR